MNANTSVASPAPGAASRADDASRRNLLIFELSNQAYALFLDNVQEIAHMAALARPPGLPSLLAGFLNLGGAAVVVVRPHVLFGLGQHTPGLYTPLVILRNPEFPLALLVDRIKGIVSLAQTAIMPVEKDYALNDCALGVATVNDARVIVLCASRLLLEKEQQCLAELDAMEQARLDDLQKEGT